MRAGRTGSVIACAMAIVAATAMPAGAYPRPGRTHLVSVASDGTQAGAISWAPSISADGLHVAFHSDASNLVPGDTNGVQDVFVHDRRTGSTQRVSVASDGTQGDRASAYPSISADGRFVAFMSWARNLVPGQSARPKCFNDVCPDVFVHDREAGITERVSVAGDGTEGDEGSGVPTISADGRHVSFDSVATNLIPDDVNVTQAGQGVPDVFVHDRETGSTEKVSVASDGTQGLGASHASSISPDGRYVAFQSLTSNLVPDDTNRDWDVFLHDREEGTTERVSVGPDGVEGNAGSHLSLPDVTNPVVSAGGRYVAFYSRATNLVPGDTNGVLDIFVRDREAGTTERVSVASDGREGNGNSYSAALTPDGRHVSFYSLSTNLVPGDTNSAADAFVHDRTTGVTERVSVSSDGVQGNGHSYQPVMSADGRHVAFYGLASNLVPGDTNGTHDVFVRDRGPAAGVGKILAAAGGGDIQVSGWATFSGEVVSSATDPDDDGASIGPLSARDLGAELTAASVVYRPEQEDLLVRLRLSSLPHVAVSPWPAPSNVVPPPTSGAGSPAVLYGLALRIGGVHHEVRALRVGAAATPPSLPFFALYRCDPEGCAEAARLSGGIGTSGNEVRVAVSLADLGAAEGASLEGLRAFTALGEAAPGTLAPLDEVALPDASIPTASVALGISPAGTPEDEVVFETEATITEGRFGGSLDPAGLPPGDREVWARACLGDACGAATTQLGG